MERQELIEECILNLYVCSELLAMEEWIPLFLLIPVVGVTLIAMYCVYGREEARPLAIELAIITN